MQMKNVNDIKYVFLLQEMEYFQVSFYLQISNLYSEHFLLANKLILPWKILNYDQRLNHESEYV